MAENVTCIPRPKTASKYTSTSSANFLWINHVFRSKWRVLSNDESQQGRPACLKATGTFTHQEHKPYTPMWSWMKLLWHSDLISRMQKEHWMLSGWHWMEPSIKLPARYAQGLSYKRKPLKKTLPKSEENVLQLWFIFFVTFSFSRLERWPPSTAGAVAVVA